MGISSTIWLMECVSSILSQKTLFHVDTSCEQEQGAKAEAEPANWWKK
jgi:hypothetical protein